MAAIDEIDLKTVANTQTAQELRKFINFLMWDWFDKHQDNKVVKIKWWFIGKQVRVKDLREVFVLIFGEPGPL